jgi:hypothetical protein
LLCPLPPPRTRTFDPHQFPVGRSGGSKGRSSPLTVGKPPAKAVPSKSVGGRSTARATGSSQRPPDPFVLLAVIFFLLTQTFIVEIGHLLSSNLLPRLIPEFPSRTYGTVLHSQPDPSLSQTQRPTFKDTGTSNGHQPLQSTAARPLSPSSFVPYSQ